MIERFPRQLKAASCATADSFRWIEFLPIVLLGLRSSIKYDIGYSPAELYYGSSFRLPDHMIVPANTQGVDTTNFVERLRDYKSKLPYMNTRKQDIKTYLPKEYSSWTHFFVHNDALKHPLTAQYSVLHVGVKTSCTNKVSILDLNGRKFILSLVILKNGSH
ncbi:uncharacterized protein LOC115222317 [Octopus sinensis]|uniref:Uncharacterized protein LOC115222317 n=1 Tax=Octopus sinensis TaxID=2607531 RepID=A0A6P7TDG7_9MOLL|nr:uncharacterized protein LOC115222317 [Octopus sinensis]